VDSGQQLSQLNSTECDRLVLSCRHWICSNRVPVEEETRRLLMNVNSITKGSKYNKFRQLISGPIHGTATYSPTVCAGITTTWRSRRSGESTYSHPGPTIILKVFKIGYSYCFSICSIGSATQQHSPLLFLPTNDRLGLILIAKQCNGIRHAANNKM